MLGCAVDTAAPRWLRPVIGLLCALATLVSIQVTGLYRSRHCVRRLDEFSRILASAIVGSAVYILCVQWRYGKIGLAPLICGTCCVVLLVAFRWHYRQWLQDRRAHGFYLRRVIIVGVNDDAAQLRKLLEAEPALGYQVAAMVGTDNVEEVHPRPSSLGTIESIPDVALSTESNGVLLVPNAMTGATMRRVIDVAVSHGLHVQIWPGIEGVGSRRLRLHPLSGEMFFYVKPLSVRRWQMVTKRALDVVGSLIGLVLIAPIILLAGILIKLDDRGPMFHRAERVGKGGSHFVVTKLRTMVVNPDLNAAVDLEALNERTDGPLFKSSRDPRVTRIGRFLRASSIDELPQLWNVLTGSMSLVGPRPALPQETAQFDEGLLRRLTVHPGLTGLWQIEARDNPSFNAYRRLDLYYVDNWSLMLDLSILVTTPVIVLSRACLALLYRVGGYLGFASSLDTALRGRLSHAVVMRVRAERPSYWIGETFDAWNGESWSSSTLLYWNDRQRLSVRPPGPGRYQRGWPNRPADLLYRQLDRRPDLSNT